jgi:FAR-17a/AIG1-like protein
LNERYFSTATDFQQLAVVISIIYWSLMLFFPVLIIPNISISEPTSSGAAPPPFRLGLDVDLAIHALPAISLLLNFVLFEKKYSNIEVWYGAPAMAAAMALWYGSLVEYCATYNGACKSDISFRHLL